MGRPHRPALSLPDPLALLATGVLVAAGILNLWTIDRRDLATHQAAAVLGGLLLLLILRRARTRSLPLLGRAAYVTALVMLAALRDGEAGPAPGDGRCAWTGPRDRAATAAGARAGSHADQPDAAPA